MKRSRFIEEQIIGILREQEASIPVAGHLGAPVAPPGSRAQAAVLGIVLPPAVLYPLMGLSLVVAVLLDIAFQKPDPRRIAP